MSVKLTGAQLVMMSVAAQRKDRCLSAPATIKGAALSKVGVKLAELGLAREIEAKAGAPIWHHDGAGQAYALKLTAAGLKAIAVYEGEPAAIEPGEAPQPGAKNVVSPDEAAIRPGRPPARRQQVGVGDRTSAARRRRDHRRFDSGYGMAAAFTASPRVALAFQHHVGHRQEIGGGVGTLLASNHPLAPPSRQPRSRTRPLG
jgi:hypothetical protein